MSDWTTLDILEAMGYDLADLHAFLHRQTLRKRWPLRRLVYRGYPHGPHPKASDKTGIIAQNFQRDLERYRSTLADYLIANVVGDDESLDVPYWMPRYERDELHDRLLYWCRELDFRTIPGSWSRKVRKRKWETKSTSVQSLKMGWWHELLLKKVSGSGIALGGRSIGRGAALHAAATQSSQLRRIRHADSTCTASPTPKPQGYGRPRSRQAPIGSRRDHTP